MKRCGALVDQTLFGSPDGNCLAACLATLFGLKIDDVPKFPLDEWLFGVQQFVRGQGYAYHYIDNSGSCAFMPDGWHIGAGLSPRGLLHACVFQDGILTHDPHPSRDGIISVRFWHLIFHRSVKVTL
jgi:hypothetical protein